MTESSFKHFSQLPKNIQYVWHGLNDSINLKNFLKSPVEWGECDIRFDQNKKNLILRHDNLSPNVSYNSLLKFDELAQTFSQNHKSLKADLKEESTLENIINIIDTYNFEQKNLWINANISCLKETGFKKVKKKYPNIILQVPIDKILQQCDSNISKTKNLIQTYLDWGINRFSVSWEKPDRETLIRILKDLNLEINLYNVPDLQSFLQAINLSPTSITSDFNFPEWGLYGRGSGKDDIYLN